MDEVGIGSSFNVNVIKAITIPTTKDWVITLSFFITIIICVYLIIKRWRKKNAQY